MNTCCMDELCISHILCAVMRSTVYMFKLELRSYSANSNIHVYVYVLYIVCMNCVFFFGYMNCVYLKCCMHELCILIYFTICMRYVEVLEMHMIPAVLLALKRR